MHTYEEIVNNIEQQINTNPIMLYMKGEPQMPQCGFSAQVVKVLMACGHKFSYVDVLAQPEIRQTLPKYANWPTFPQLYVQGELVGGCDIVMELYQTGELQKILDAAMEQAGSE